VRWIVRSLTVVTVFALLTPASGEAQRRDRNKIVQEELVAEKSGGTIFDAVRTLRPQWFRESQSRQLSGVGSTPADQMMPILYIDGVKMESLQMMNGVPVERIKELRYMGGRDAQMRYGMGHGGGVIDLTTVKPEPRG